MPQNEKINLAGFNIKEWSLIILITAIALVFIVFTIGMAIAIINDPTGISFTGNIDLSQFTGVIIGIAMVATTLVAQQLTAKNQAAAVAATDEAWKEDQP